MVMSTTSTSLRKEQMGGDKSRGLGRTKTSRSITLCVFAYGQAPQLLRMVKTSENPIVPSSSTSATHDDPPPPESLEEPKFIVKAASVCVLVDVAVMVLVPTGKGTSSSSGPVGRATSSEVTLPTIPIVWITSLVNSKVKLAVSSHPGLRVKLSPLEAIKHPGHSNADGPLSSLSGQLTEKADRLAWSAYRPDSRV